MFIPRMFAGFTVIVWLILSKYDLLTLSNESRDSDRKSFNFLIMWLLQRQERTAHRSLLHLLAFLNEWKTRSVETKFVMGTSICKCVTHSLTHSLTPV